MCMKVENLSASSMVTIAELLIDGVKKGVVESGRLRVGERGGGERRLTSVLHSKLILYRSLELFPKLLSVIAAQPRIEYQRGQHTHWITNWLSPAHIS